MTTAATPPPTEGADVGVTMTKIVRTVRMAMMYAVVVRLVRSLTTTGENKMMTSTGDASVSVSSTPRPAAYAEVCRNVYRKGTPMDLRVYVNARDDWRWTEPAATRRRVRLGVDEVETFEIDVGALPDVLEAVRANATLRVHSVLSVPGATVDPEEETYDERKVLWASADLTAYRAMKFTRRKKLLAATAAANVSDGEEESAMMEDGTEYVQAYFKPNMTMSVVDDFTAYRPETIPEVLSRQMRFVDDKRSGYYPTVYMNEFWLIKSYLQPLNETSAATLKLRFNLDNIAMFRWQFYSSLEQSWDMQRQFGAAGENDADNMKRIFLEGNPVLLAITTFVSVLHTVFDFLAFKNDVQFWRNKKSMEGLSSRSVLVNAVCQWIIFLYLCDNETSWMILFSSGMGCLIEAWKVTRAFDVSVERAPRSVPRLRIREKESALKSETARHDADAMRYMSYALYPLCIVYAGYSLHTHEHKSWYSFILNSLVGAVYTFGFILMTPQLYLNYKMKSVAAMPWKQMGYKFLNTIIDDLFAFVIKMPTLHRISVFRDDVVFLAFLYQRRIYRVDASRVNEFGWSAEGTEQPPVENVENDDGEDDKDDDAIETKKDR